jgi:hypothetical protein
VNEKIHLAPALLAPLQPSDNPVVNAMDLGGEVLVGELRSTVADDDIADRMSAFGGNTDIPFQGRQDRF